MKSSEQQEQRGQRGREGRTGARAAGRVTTAAQEKIKRARYRVSALGKSCAAATAAASAAAAVVRAVVAATTISSNLSSSPLSSSPRAPSSTSLFFSRLSCDRQQHSLFSSPHFNLPTPTTVNTKPQPMALSQMPMSARGAAHWIPPKAGRLSAGVAPGLPRSLLRYFIIVLGVTQDSNID